MFYGCLYAKDNSDGSTLEYISDSTAIISKVFITNLGDVDVTVSVYYREYTVNTDGTTTVTKSVLTYKTTVAAGDTIELSGIVLAPQQGLYIDASNISVVIFGSKA